MRTLTLYVLFFFITERVLTALTFVQGDHCVPSTDPTYWIFRE